MKLQQVIRDITGKTGMDIIEAIVQGERSPRRLARLRDPRTKSDESTIARSLQGHWREGAPLRAGPGSGAVTGPTRPRSPSATRRLKPSWSGLRTAATAKNAPAPNGKRRNQKNAPRFDVQGQLYRMTGVDLDQD